jgi:hypothetical protein
MIYDGLAQKITETTIDGVSLSKLEVDLTEQSCAELRDVLANMQIDVLKVEVGSKISRVGWQTFASGLYASESLQDISISNGELDSGILADLFVFT